MREAPGVRPARGLLLLLLLGLGACTSLSEEVQVSPLFARYRTADAAVEVEALGGAWLSRHPDDPLETQIHALRPLWSLRRQRGGAAGDGADLTHYLPPFGLHRRTSHGTTSTFLLLFYYQSRPLPSGAKSWDLISLPGILWSRREGSTPRAAWFPFGGKVDHLFTYDRIVFVLWPLYTYTEREGVKSWQWLWPFFGWTRGEQARGWRVWPLYAYSEHEGRFVRRFFLWPFLHFHRAWSPGGKTEATKFHFWPIYGRTSVGTYRSHTVLWPFFGWATDPRASFWAVDTPWPIVRIQRGGKDPRAERRTRLWPLYSYYRADRLESRSYLWPIVHIRHERYVASERDSLYVVPFVQAWTRRDLRGGLPTSYRKLWPLYVRLDEGGAPRTAIPALNPFWRNEAIEFHYAWLWEVYTFQVADTWTRRRAWMGLWRRESSTSETRWALGPLASSRSFGAEGERTRETALVFGLLRWRVSPRDGFRLLLPSFPGPGWPLEPAGAGASEPAGAAAEAGAAGAAGVADVDGSGR